MSKSFKIIDNTRRRILIENSKIIIRDLGRCGDTKGACTDCPFYFIYHNSNVCSFATAEKAAKEFLASCSKEEGKYGY